MMRRLNVGKFSRYGWQFYFLAAFLALVFLTGGSSRADVTSLAILRPASVLVCGIALVTLTKQHFLDYRFLFVSAILSLLLVALYLVPLPFNASSARLVQAIDQDISFDIARPLAVAPLHSWNSLFALAVPLAVLLLLVQLKREALFSILPILIFLASASGLVGLLQSLGGGDGSLYFYAITNNGEAVGFFANRNHQAALLALLFPMLAVYASYFRAGDDDATFRRWVAGFMALLLVPLILVTGSRSGFILAALGVLASLYLYGKDRARGQATRIQRRPWWADWRTFLAAAAILSLTFTTIDLSRAQAIERFADQADELRFVFWGPIVQIMLDSLPFGTGPGNLSEVYNVVEPTSTLSRSYLNHAHNDPLEVLLNFGYIGAVALLAASICLIVAAGKALRRRSSSVRTVAMGRLSVVAILMTGLASITDYPLRTPVMSSIFVIALVWLATVASQEMHKDGHPAPKAMA